MKKHPRLILEFTEFNAMRLNPDSAGMATHVDNPQLSINAFDRHEDAIRAGISRINTILHALSNTAGYASLKSKLALENQQVTKIKILRITKPNQVNFDVYLKFNIGEDEYFGVIEDLLGSATFKSEVFKDNSLLQTKEWIIRIRGLITKLVKQSFYPEVGEWRLVNDKIICYAVETGKMVQLEKGAIVEVKHAYDHKIVIKFGNNLYNLVNDNFVYFNWWFEKVA